jgi:hypothetical protein
MGSARRKVKSQKRSNRLSLRGAVHILSLVIIVSVVLIYWVFTRVLPDLGPEETSFAAPPISSSTTPVVLEAEQMSTFSYSGGLQIFNDTSASGGQGMMFSINTRADGAVSIPETTSKLTITAKSDRCHGGPTMVVLVGDREVINKKVTSASWSDYTARINLPPGSHNVSISLLNDYSTSSGQGCDRALFVDKLTFQ